MNASDVAQDTNATTWSFDAVAEETIDAWTRLVRCYYPNLATPIARALAQRALQGPYGFALFSISQGIHQFDETALRELTGSELQMLSALLQELREQTQRLLVQVNALWHPDLEKIAHLASESRRAGIEILPPDVRYSDVQFSIESERRAICYGIGAIKNVGEGAARTIVNARCVGEPFSSLADFCQRVLLKQVNRRALEALISAGALDGLGERAVLLKSVERLIACSAAASMLQEKGQLSLFENAAAEFANVELVFTAPMSQAEKAKLEREHMGIVFAEDSMERLRALLRERNEKALSSIALADCTEQNGMLTTAGIIKSIRKTKTKKGEPMAFVQIQDDEGDVELVLFPRAYTNAASLLHKENAILVEGRIQTRDDKNSFIVERVQALFDDDTQTASEGDSTVENVVTNTATDSPLPPLRRIAEARAKKTIAVAQPIPSAPPLRRAATVFGTRGSEIVTRHSPIPARVEEQRDDELEIPNDALEIQEKSVDGQDVVARRIYIHFRELPPEEGAAYVRPLFELFNAHPGADEVALLFERSDAPIQIGAPHGVDYDAISNAVVEMIGEDAMVEI